MFPDLSAFYLIHKSPWSELIEPEPLMALEEHCRTKQWRTCGSSPIQTAQKLRLTCLKFTITCLCRKAAGSPRRLPVHLLHSRITAKSLLICHHRHGPAATVTSWVPEEVINAWKAPWSPREQQAACIMERRF